MFQHISFTAKHKNSYPFQVTKSILMWYLPLIFHQKAYIITHMSTAHNILLSCITSEKSWWAILLSY